jgi:hypothetical protein
MTVPPTTRTTALGRALGDVVASASGTELRQDPVAPRTGGPAGNARLTAWTGLLLLAGFLAECFTLLSLHSMLTAHFLIGGILIPLVLLKTATTGWRIARYYLGDHDYRAAGPPPLLLRVLGPLVVATGLAVLGTGLALIPLGDSSFNTLVTVAGRPIDPLTLHKLCFVLWLVITGAHVLARTMPAVQLTSGRARRHGRVPGRPARAAAVAVTLALSVVTGAVVSNLHTSWTGGDRRGRFEERHHERGDGLAVVPLVPTDAVGLPRLR